MLKNALAALALAIAAVSTIAGPADARRTSNPPITGADCREAEPRTRVAEVCEDAGWVIRNEFAINPNRIVARNELPRCTEAGESDCYLSVGDPLATYPNLGEVRITRYDGLRLVWYVEGFRDGTEN